MEAFSAYTVLHNEKPGAERPYCIFKVTLQRPDDKPVPVDTLHRLIADHGSRNIALYWATQLNEGRCTEEECKAEIESYK